MIEILKFVHIAGIAVWAGGLVAMPFLFVQRAGIALDRELHRMHAMVRYFYVVILSPSAFIAVASGTALIFARQTFVDWFTLKLFLVGLLVIIHVLTGLVILRLFDEAEHYPAWRYYTITGVTTLVISAILFVVGAKPDFNFADYTGDLLRPGALGDLLEPVISTVIR